MTGDLRQPGHAREDASGAAPLVQLIDVTRRFGATTALAGVSFDVGAAETVGLLGSNGAGKSTLIKILSGIFRPTSGNILVEGKPQDIESPVHAREQGIVTVHQNINDGVVFGMTVAENLLLEEFSRTTGGEWLTYRAIRRKARAMLDRLQMDLPLDVPVETLGASGRQEIAIARALVKKPKLLILDEPTSTLSAREAERLFARVASMQRDGVAILYVSHRMSEVERLCHRAVVLRNGQVVSIHAAPLDTRAIAQSILGELVLSAKHEPRAGEEQVLAGQGLRITPDGPAFDIALKRGEVVGLTGLVGAGKTELLEQLAGLRPLTDGSLTLNGRAYAPRDPSEAFARGIAMVPEERASQSLFPEQSVTDHTTIGLLKNFSRFGLMRRTAETRFAEQVIARFRVRCPGPLADIEALSGGNQQKVLVGRWLMDSRSLVILDEPFRGIDIGARAVISEALRRYSETTAVIVCSSDPEEVIDVADRVLVLVEGQIVREFRSDEVSADQLATVMSGPLADRTIIPMMENT